MKFDVCEWGNGITLYAGKYNRFVMSLCFLCVSSFLYNSTLILVL
jgi:hypothetical protein